METLLLLGFLLSAAKIAAVGLVVIAIWYGMKTLVKMADSFARIADAVERIDETIRSREKERL